MSSTHSSLPRDTLSGLRVAFAGKLAGLTKREAQQLVRAHGATTVDDLAGADLVILGEASPNQEIGALLGHDASQALSDGKLVALNETQLWQRLGLIELDSNVSRMYTPAMLAELIGVPVATVRRWHRCGLLAAGRQFGQLAYFDFAQVATARQLSALSAAGVSQRQIEKQFSALARWFPDARGTTAQAPLVVEGKRLLVRAGEGLVEAHGQQRLDFDSRDNSSASDAVTEAVVPLGAAAESPLTGPEDMVESAHALEDNGQLELAAEMYRAALAAGGPHPETCFALADVLYRLGDLNAARERYYMAIELDENYVEARANLGCVLAETGQLDLAVSAFEGALACHPDFPDAHYHLGRVLDELGRTEQAAEHWRSFLELAPDSPWAAAARERLSL
ncbi:MAG TPA: tetratricopeptide repeat protein [Pirellulales bacterium]|nr:tetratricopeptide repeat protein [Pirellulales bacterium]